MGFHCPFAGAGRKSLFSIPGVYGSATACFMGVIAAAAVFVKLVSLKKQKKAV
jgi:hypothetical protein